MKNNQKIVPSIEENSPKQNRQAIIIWRRFYKQPAALVSLAIILVILILALITPFLNLPSPRDMTGLNYSPPTWKHPMGTDNLGRDVFVRTIWGLRLGLLVAVVVAGISTILGIIFGAISGYIGGLADDFISRVFDLFLLIPPFFLIILVVSIFGANVYFIMLVIGLTTWPRSARIMRAQVLSIKNRTFVHAAKSVGATDGQTLFFHVIPNGIAPVVTNGTILMGSAILIEAGLSYLGLGDQNVISLGRLISEGQIQLVIAPWMAIFPGLVMLLMIGAFNILGDALNIAFDPRLDKIIGYHHITKPKINEKATDKFYPNGDKEPGLETGEVPILEVRGLDMWYSVDKAYVRAVDNVSLKLKRGGSLGVVGESGCGKSSLAMAFMRALPPNGLIHSGQFFYDGMLIPFDKETLFQPLRWKKIAMVFQGAMNVLNPVFRVGDLIYDAYKIHNPSVTREKALQRAEDLFNLVGIPLRYLKSYPHELSGGMKQRVVIVMSLLLQPEVIILDEPTTALDVLVQDQILGEIDRLRKELDLSIILISHDMGIIAEMCEHVAVMYAGQIVEIGTTETIFNNPHHPYTRSLLATLPTIHGPRVRLQSIQGSPPDLIDPPFGCRYQDRCAWAVEGCDQPQKLLEITNNVNVRCHIAVKNSKINA